MRTNARTLARTLPLAVLTASALTTAHAQPAFHLIGNPTGLVSEVFGLSRDGTVACGSNARPSGSSEVPSSFRWTLSGGREDFLVGSGAGGVSADGSTIVGGWGQPYRRLVDGTIQSLGTLPGFTSGGARAVSADGSAVTGSFSRLSGGHEFRDPFRWTPSGGMQPLTGLGGGLTEGYDISDDGRTIVGTYKPDTSGSPTRAFVWREGVGATFLTSAAGMDRAEAYACSADGSIVAGVAPMQGAGRWVSGFFEDIGSAGDYTFARPMDMSDDGSVIIGNLLESASGKFDSTFVWTPTTGMMESVDYLKMMGVPLPDGKREFRVQAVSGDGLSFGGVMERFTSDPPPGQGFVANVPAPGLAIFCPALVIAIARRRR